jgi:hypothetical protein
MIKEGRMRLTGISLVIILVIIVFFCGCTRNYIVKPFPLEPELVPKIGQIKGPINLINTQVPGTKTVFKSGPAIDWVGDLHEWTTQAIDLLTHELTQRKVFISRNADRVLSLAVTKGTLRSEITGVRCVIILRVTTGNGYVKEYEGNNIHRASPFGEMARYYAGANALTEAVIALLNDDNIVRYLQE